MLRLRWSLERNAPGFIGMAGTNHPTPAGGFWCAAAPNNRARTDARVAPADFEGAVRARVADTGTMASRRRERHSVGSGSFHLSAEAAATRFLLASDVIYLMTRTAK